MAAIPPSGPPTGSPPPRTLQRARASAARDGGGGGGNPELAAASAQRDANKQIEAAGKSVEAARRDADVQIDSIKDDYAHREENAYAREQADYEKQRLKGYERLRELRYEQDKELSRVHREGSRELERSKNYYLDTTYNVLREGETKLQNMRAQQGRSIEHAEQTKNEDIALAQEQFTRQYQETREMQQARMAQLQTDNGAEYERIRANSALATEKARESFDQKYAERVKASDETLATLNSRTSQAIRDVRRDTTDKLAAYSQRQRDPFYRMLDLDVNVSDEGDFYELTARIPEHEQSHVSVAVKGSQLVLSGYRRNEEKLELEPGRSHGTNSYQSFLETFPIAWPVDAKKMTREFEGDRLTVRVPKKNDYAYKSEQQARVDATVTRARVERPNFPDNLPHVNRDPYADDSPGDPRDTVVPASGDKRAKGKRGSGTLA